MAKKKRNKQDRDNWWSHIKPIHKPLTDRQEEELKAFKLARHTENAHNGAVELKKCAACRELSA